MRLIGMMACRNDSWVIGLSLRIALLWCDEIVVHLHACTDKSAEIIGEIMHEHNERVTPFFSDDPTWQEMEQRQAMLEVARMRGATQLAIIDADEVLTGNLVWDGVQATHRCARDWITGTEQGQILQLPLYNLRGSLNKYHSSGVWGCNRFLSVAFADDPRLCWQGDTFHRREPQGAYLRPYKPIAHGQGGVLHLWGVNERRLRAKHALYKITEHLKFPDRPIADIEAEYNLWRSPEDAGVKWPAQTDWQKPWTFSDVPKEWWEPYAHLMKYLEVDAEPWQEAEVQRFVKEHGADRFAGLDLFGVA